MPSLTCRIPTLYSTSPKATPVVTCPTANASVTTAPAETGDVATAFHAHTTPAATTHATAFLSEARLTNLTTNTLTNSLTITLITIVRNPASVSFYAFSAFTILPITSPAPFKAAIDSITQITTLPASYLAVSTNTATLDDDAHLATASFVG